MRSHSVKNHEIIIKNLPWSKVLTTWEFLRKNEFLTEQKIDALLENLTS